MEWSVMRAALEIRAVNALPVLDSRGRPTVRAFVELSNGMKFAATAPAGASTGLFESVERRDGGSRYGGLGVDLAVASIRNEISEALGGRDPREQGAIDETLIQLDGMPDRSSLGANAIVAVSMAVARAGAAVSRQALWQYLAAGQATSQPVPLMNVFNGGAHAAGGLRIQECMLVPHGPATTAERVRCGAEIYAALRTHLVALGVPTGVGDEGGFIYHGTDVRGALDLLVAAIEAAGYRPGTDVSLAIDAAANALYDGRLYAPQTDLQMDSDALTTWWGALLDEYPIVLLEDPCSEEDWPGWHHLTRELGARATIVGDDIFVTHARLIERGITEGIANAVLLKPNQIGTVTETIEAASIARKAGYKIVVSHRSGETCDAFITDLAVALGADYLKAGAPARSERTEKYNRLMEIEAGIA